MQPKKGSNRAFVSRLRRLVRRRDPVSKRRRNTLVGEDERGDMLLLHRAGYTLARIAATLDRSEATVAKVIHESQEKLRERFEEPLLASYVAAAAVAAEGGDHRPALDMLDRLGVIPETSRQRTALAVAHMTSEAQRAMVTNGAKQAALAHGPTVNIGIGLPSQLMGSDLTVLSSTVQSPERAEKQGILGPGRALPDIEQG